jgi:hypothetical protein
MAQLFDKYHIVVRDHVDMHWTTLASLVCYSILFKLMGQVVMQRMKDQPLIVTTMKRK